MNVSLLPLLPRKIAFRERNFRLLKDRHVFNTLTVAAADVSKDYFLTVGTDKKSQSNFQGDKSLVKEANLYLVIGLQGEIRSRFLTSAEWFTFWDKGQFTWAIIVPETVTVDEDGLASISTGPQPFSRVDAAAAPTDRATHLSASRYDQRRAYLVGENKIVPGGRAVEFNVQWAEAGGNGLASSVDFKIIFAGGEYEPMRG